MPDTYDTAAEAEADRTQQKALLAALNGWDRALRRDECGAWRITGSRGSIHTWGDSGSWILNDACVCELFARWDRVVPTGRIRVEVRQVLAPKLRMSAEGRQRLSEQRRGGTS